MTEKIYEAQSLDDIARLFDRMAANAIDRQKFANTLKQKAIEAASARAYADCATVLRQTSLVGP